MSKFTKGFWVVIIFLNAILITILTFFTVRFLNADGEKVIKKEKGGNIYLNYSNNFSGLTLRDAVATTDLVGMKNDKEDSYFDFSVESDLKEANYIDYEITLSVNKQDTTINNNDIKIYLEKEIDGEYNNVFGPEMFVPIEKNSILGSKKGNMIIFNSRIKKSSIENFRLRMWISDKSIVKKGNYSVNVNINGKAK